MERTSGSSYLWAGMLLAVFSGLYLTTLYSYLLFHSLAELFCVAIAGGIFMISWHFRRYSISGYFLFIGIAFLYIGIIDLLHALAYSGMGVFRGYGADLPTQLWISARYMQALSFLAAPIFLERRLNTRWAFAVYSAVTAVLLLSIFSWHVFPSCYMEESGLTPFKVLSEYIISALLLASIPLLLKKGEKLDRQVLRLTIASILATVASEMAFTLYTDVYGVLNMIGHFFKILAFFLIYRAIIVMGIFKPYDVLFRDLKESEEKHRTILENIEDGYHEVDLAGSFTFFNESFRKIMGYTDDEMMGMNYRHYAADEENADHVFRAYNRVYKTGEPLQRFEWDIIRKDGARRSVEVSVSLIRDADGRRRGFRGIVRDTTDRKRKEDILRQALEKSRELEFIVNHSPAVVWLWRAAEGWPVEYVSDSLALFGYRPEDFTSGRIAYASIVHPDDLPKVAAEVETYTRDGRTDFTQEYRLVTKSGDTRWIDDRTWVRRGTDGSVTHYQGIILDITERKRAEELYRTVAEQSFAGVYMMQKGTFVYVNPRFAVMGGYPPDDMVGMKSLSIVHPDDRDDVRRYALEMLRGERRMPYEFRIVTKNGETRWIMETVSSIKYEGRPSVLGTTTDVTEIKKAEEDLRRAYRELQGTKDQLIQTGRLAALGQIAAGAAHEIFNPLNIMLMRVQLLESKEPLTKAVKTALDSFKTQINRIVRIVDGLKDFSQPSPAGKEAVQVNEFVEKNLAACAHRLDTEKVEVKKEFQAELPLLYIDVQRMEKTFLHIISNALDAMRNSERKELDIKTVLMTGDAKGMRVRITVSDTGAGIKEGALNRVFDPFYTTKGPDKGTGLGLWVAYGTITDHGGTIRAENNAAGGASFFIELPVGSPEDKFIDD